MSKDKKVSEVRLQALLREAPGLSRLDGLERLKPMSNNYDAIILAQRVYITKHFGRAVANRSEYGVGSDGERTYVESLVKTAGSNGHKYDRILATYVTDADGKTSLSYLRGRPNTLKHVISVIGKEVSP